MKWLFNPCGRYRQDISLLASGALPDAESDGAKKHVAVCPACQSHYEEMQNLTTPLGNWEQNLANVQPTQAARNRWEQAIQAAGRPEPARQLTPTAAMREWWQDVVWPCRRVWAGLAVVWLLILAGNLSLRDSSQIRMVKFPPSAQEMVMALKERQSVLAELLADHSGPREADRPKFFLPKPRTERVRIFTI
jgi:anti-sigma factor RsiW